MEDSEYLRHDLDIAQSEIQKLQSDIAHLERTVNALVQSQSRLEQTLLQANTRIERLERRKPGYEDGIILD